VKKYRIHFIYDSFIFYTLLRINFVYLPVELQVGLMQERKSSSHQIIAKAERQEFYYENYTQV